VGVISSRGTLKSNIGFGVWGNSRRITERRLLWARTLRFDRDPRAAGIGARPSLLDASAKVGFIQAQRTLSLGSGPVASCPEAAARWAG
jgi:hypothetical protein